MSGGKLVLLIMLYITITWAVLQLTGCGPVTDYGVTQDYLEDYVAPDLKADYSLFIREMDNRGLPPVHVPEVIEWGVLLERGMVGVCEWPARRVTLDISLRGDAARTRAVLHHELAHCMYSIREHDSEVGHVMSEYEMPGMQPRTEHEWHAEWDRLAEFILEHAPAYRAAPRAVRPTDVAGGA